MKIHNVTLVFACVCLAFTLWLGVEQPDYIPLVAALAPEIIRVITEKNQDKDEKEEKDTDNNQNKPHKPK